MAAQVRFLILLRGLFGASLLTKETASAHLRSNRVEALGFIGRRGIENHGRWRDRRVWGRCNRDGHRGGGDLDLLQCERERLAAKLHDHGVRSGIVAFYDYCCAGLVEPDPGAQTFRRLKKVELLATLHDEHAAELE